MKKSPFPCSTCCHPWPHHLPSKTQPRALAAQSWLSFSLLFFFFHTVEKRCTTGTSPGWDGGGAGRRWCCHLHWCPHPTSPVCPGVSPHWGSAPRPTGQHHPAPKMSPHFRFTCHPFRLGCLHGKVRLPYLLGFSTGGGYLWCRLQRDSFALLSIVKGAPRSAHMWIHQAGTVIMMAIISHSRFPSDVSLVQMSCHPALEFCDANTKPSGRQAGPRPASHSTGEKHS